MDEVIDFSMKKHKFGEEGKGNRASGAVIVDCDGQWLSLKRCRSMLMPDLRLVWHHQPLFFRFASVFPHFLERLSPRNPFPLFRHQSFSEAVMYHHLTQTKACQTLLKLVQPAIPHHAGSSNVAGHPPIRMRNS
jgi:hypothetical protein